MTHAPALPMEAADPKSPAAEQANHVAAVALSHSSALLTSDSFLWFVENCLDAAIRDAQEAALDPSTPPETCDRARHVRAALVAVRDWTGQQREAARAKLDA